MFVKEIQFIWAQKKKKKKKRVGFCLKEIFCLAHMERTNILQVQLTEREREREQIKAANIEKTPHSRVFTKFFFI